MPLYSRDSSNCWTDDKQVLNCYTVGMATDHFIVERANRAGEEFANSLLDFLLVLVNIICFISNISMIIYKHTDRRDSNSLE